MSGGHFSCSTLNSSGRQRLTVRMLTFHAVDSGIQHSAPCAVLHTSYEAPACMIGHVVGKLNAPHLGPRSAFPPSDHALVPTESVSAFRGDNHALASIRAPAGAATYGPGRGSASTRILRPLSRTWCGTSGCPTGTWLGGTVPAGSAHTISRTLNARRTGPFCADGARRTAFDEVEAGSTRDDIITSPPLRIDDRRSRASAGDLPVERRRGGRRAHRTVRMARGRVLHDPRSRGSGSSR
jgi:hypothetical protein